MTPHMMTPATARNLRWSPTLSLFWLILFVIGVVGSTPAAASAAESRSTRGATNASANADEAESDATAPAAPIPGEAQFWEAMLLLEDPSPEQQKRGRELLRDAADAEFAMAQCFLAECHLQGSNGFPKNERRAAEWFRLAAEGGYVPAKAYLGILWFEGVGLRRDHNKALPWLQAVEREAASFTLATPPDWFLESLRARSATAIDERQGGTGNQPTPSESLFGAAHHRLAEILAVQNRPAEALRLYEAAAYWGQNARAGVYDAARKAAMSHALGRGTPRNLTRANELLEHSRQLVRTRSLASFHSLWSQKQVDDFELASFEEAVSAMADQSLQQELQNVADALLKENPAEAIKWCEIASESGEGWAMVKLGELYLSDAAGAVDREKAFFWYRRGALEKDMPLAWANYAICLLRGLGTAADPAEAQRILAEKRPSNFMCALAEVGRIPQQHGDADAWQTELQNAALQAKIPIAQYHLAMRELERAASAEANPNANPNPRQRGAARAPRKSDIFSWMESAAKAGIPDACLQLGAMYEFGYHDAVNLPRAREAYTRGAELGSSLCAARLGTLAHQGIGEKRNLSAALAHFQRAIELDPDNANAHNDIAIVYLDLLKEQFSNTLLQERRDALVHHLREADRLENPAAALNLGRLYYEGRFFRQDFREAYIYFQTAAERGSAVANRFLGHMHDHGQGVPETPKDALYYYRLAALEGDIEALRKVCDFYLTGRAEGVDLNRAMFWIQLLALSGDVIAYLTFGDLLIEHQRYREALKYWNAFAEVTDMQVAGAAYERLSRIYEKGLGVRPNPGRAEQYLTRAIHAGNVTALCRISRRLIVEKKAADALPHLRRAMAAGSAEAHYLMGCLYFAGDGVERNEQRGWELVRTSADNRYPEAQLNIAMATLNNRAGAPSLEDAIRYAAAAEAAGVSRARQVREQLEARRAQAAPPPESDSDRARSI